MALAICSDIQIPPYHRKYQIPSLNYLRFSCGKMVSLSKKVGMHSAIESGGQALVELHITVQQQPWILKPCGLGSRSMPMALKNVADHFE